MNKKPSHTRRCFPSGIIPPLIILFSFLILAPVTACHLEQPGQIEQALSKAGGNRTELERAIKHYSTEKDPLKLEAMKFLVANMDGHGYTLAAFYDKDGNEIEFDALDYGSYKEARTAFDILEDEHGEIDYKRKRFDEDAATITAGYLIENIELAFRARHSKPWAKKISFETFLEHILPYRGSNEPINSWRQACLDRYGGLPAKMKDPCDLAEAAELIRRDVHNWVRFDEIYYLHPTDQGFDEMNERGFGRCEDISNMMSYALRANAVPCATDYTPHWADRDNNHAWEVILDSDGRGSAGLSNRAAKIYRKTFSIRRGNLGCIKEEGEEAPRWLSGKSYIDVTDQYMETTDVSIELERATPEDARFAYICVFNDGEWKAIHWGRIEDGAVSFTAMGRNIAYLPACYADKELVPAAPPFILTKEGEVRPLRSRPGKPITIEIAATAPVTPDADTRIDRPMIVVKPGKTYELFVWKDGWESMGKREAGDEPVSFESMPDGLLFWLVEEGSRRLERIFTIEQGRQVWW